MKTFRKKMISLMLAALMLISAMPFAAFADETANQTGETPAVVDSGDSNADTYNESGTTNNDATYQNAGDDFKSYVAVVATCDGKVLLRKSDNKLCYIAENYVYDPSNATSLTIARQALMGAGLNWALYTINSVNLNTADGTLEFDLSSSSTIPHSCNAYGKVQQDSVDNPVSHKIVCSICGAETTENHTFVTVATAVAVHKLRCSRCGYVLTKDHDPIVATEYQSVTANVGTYVDGVPGVTEGYKVIAAATAATCTKKATYAKIRYDCGLVMGGESYGSLAPHVWDKGEVAGARCINCLQYYDGNLTYAVNIYVVNSVSKVPIATGTCTLTNTQLNNLKANAVGAMTVLGQTTGTTTTDQTLIDKYYKSIGTYYSLMEAIGDPINIYVTADLTDVDINANQKGYIRIVDGTDEYSRQLVIGKYYFDQIKISDNNRDLVAMVITKTNGTSRTIYKSTIGTDAKVQDDDVTCELIWDANIVTLKFYRHAGSNTLLETRQIRAGQRIDSLPLLDGKIVTWYLPSGEPLQEGRVYDFKDTTISVYPKTATGGAGDVYLLIYKNGDTKTAVDANPVNITQYIQTSSTSTTGLISRVDLQSVINKYAKGDKTYLFDYEGWEDYKDSKSTRSAADVFNVGTSSDRGVVFLYAMVTGASSTSSTKADSSNPKTGDNAMLGTAAVVMTAAVLGLGATAVVRKKKEEI